MPRHFFSDDAQARFAAARFDVIARLARVVTEEKCEFVVVAGDVFETNQVDKRTVRRALEAMAQIPVPVFLLPGNHDPLDAATVFRSSVFSAHCPKNVRVLSDGTPVRVRDGVEVVGAPWTSKRPLQDLVAQTFGALAPANDVVRIGVAHGALDSMSPSGTDPALIELSRANELVREGRIHYLALGDRHSLTVVDEGNRIAYAGAPEPTDFDEVDPGQVLVVDCSAKQCSARAVRVATWRFALHEARLSSADDVLALEKTLRAFAEKERTVLKLRLVGTLSLSAHSKLLELLDDQRELFAAIVLSASRSELVVLPNDDDFSDISLSGFAMEALQELRALSKNPDSAQMAEDALGLLVRLARRAS